MKTTFMNVSRRVIALWLFYSEFRLARAHNLK